MASADCPRHGLLFRLPAINKKAMRSGDLGVPFRLPLLVLGFVSLISGVLAGLARLGWDVPLPPAQLLLLHGPLMVSGFLGTVIGLVMGYALAWIGGHYRIIHLSAAVYSLDYLPFAPRWQDGVIVAAVALGVSLLATLYPSSSAAKILPAEALRYE